MLKSSLRSLNSVYINSTTRVGALLGREFSLIFSDMLKSLRSSDMLNSFSSRDMLKSKLRAGDLLGRTVSRMSIGILKSPKSNS